MEEKLTLRQNIYQIWIPKLIFKGIKRELDCTHKRMQSARQTRFGSKHVKHLKFFPDMR